MPGTSTADLALLVLRAADRPLTVAEIRHRIRHGTGTAVNRTTLSAALKRSAALCDVGGDGVRVWRAVP